MRTITISSKYQVAIPKEVREAVGLKAGEKLEIITYGSRIELIPVKSINHLKGKYKGIKTDVQREEDRV